MGKRIICLAVSLVTFVFSPAHAFTLTIEENTDRPGCDYRNFAVPGSKPLPFSAYSVCQAWNFDYWRISTSGAQPRCWLKNCAPAPTTHNFTIGGVKLPATMSIPEDGVKRVGCDYRNFSASGKDVCSATCARDSTCQSWYFSTRSCFLQTCVAAPKVPPNHNNIYSGVKFSNLAFTLTREFATDRPGCDYRNFAVRGAKGFFPLFYPV
jgi:hypothetical protein